MGEMQEAEITMFRLPKLFPRVKKAVRLVGGFALKGSDELNQIDLKTAEVPRRSETASGRMTSGLELRLTMSRNARFTHN